MTSNPAGDRWIDHPMLKHAANTPLAIEFHLKFVVWNPASGSFDPIEGATVRVISGTSILNAAQGGNTTETPLEALTGTGSAAGEVTFIGLILAPPASPPDLHFEISGLDNLAWYTQGSQTKLIPLSTWSSDRWKAIDGATPGTLVKFAGRKIGAAGVPVAFSVGVPCWLQFRYDRYYQDPAPARFPSGTRIKIVAINGAGNQVDIRDFRTDSGSEFKTVLFNLHPATDLRMLIFTRFVKAKDDPPDLVLSPFSVVTNNQLDVDPSPDDVEDNTALDILASLRARPFLYFDPATTGEPSSIAPAGPAGYAFHLKGTAEQLSQVPAWIVAADTSSLCTLNATTAQAASLAAKCEMPPEYAGTGAFSGLAEEVREQITRCVALAAATMIREFHALLSSLLSGRPAWQGLNLDANAFETGLIITESAGPETLEVAPAPGLVMRGRVRFPISCLFDPAAFSMPGSELSKLRYLNTRNVIFHELGHCLMFSYSFDEEIDASIYDKHLFNIFFNYNDEDWRILPFWEGWAVYYSILLLGPEVFLTTQMTRVAARDSSILRDNELATIRSRASLLTGDLANIFSSGILNSYQIHDGTAPINGQTIEQIVARPELSDAGPDKGLASEMCLSLALFSLTRFLVERKNKQLSPLTPANGDGRIDRTSALTEWHEDLGVRNALWTAIFEPFLSLRGNKPDTVGKFTRKIYQATRNDPDWHKIKKIFNTYYLLVTKPQVGSITPHSFGHASGLQSLAVVGNRFPDAATTAKDGGLRVEVTGPSGAPKPAAVTVADKRHVQVAAEFAVPGTYTLSFIGRWDPPVTRTVTVT